MENLESKGVNMKIMLAFANFDLKIVCHFLAANIT